MWTELRKNIETIRKENRISEEDFKPVDISSWQQIQEKIFSTFFNWSSQGFKNDSYSVQFYRNWPFDSLLQLVDKSETVWLFLNETVREKTKFWFYEGKIETIVFVLRESFFINEVYVASKKFEWLLYLNHHDYLIATGLTMPGKLRQLEMQNLLQLREKSV